MIPCQLQKFKCIYGEIFSVYARASCSFLQSCVRFATTGSFLNSKIHVNYGRLVVGMGGVEDLLLSISWGAGCGDLWCSSRPQTLHVLCVNPVETVCYHATDG